MNENGVTLVVVMVVTCAIGYFIVSKIVDFFKRGSAWDQRSPPPGLKDLSNPKSRMAPGPGTRIQHPTITIEDSDETDDR